MISAINIGQMKAIEESGEVIDITNLIDGDGDETEDKSKAIVFIAQLSNGKWISDLIDNYESVVTQ